MIERPALTLLYVPGDRPDRVAKALESDADVVVIDLEDAVAPAAKQMARAGLAEAVEGHGTRRRIQVRVNGSGTAWQADDLAAVALLPAPVAVRLPKCEQPAALGSVVEAVPGRGLHLLVESALGVERAFELAASHPAVQGISLGEADLRADLGVTDDTGLAWPRSRVVCAAAAARLPPPAMAVFTDVRDLDGLRASCRFGRSLGFLGRAAIHPDQLPVIVEAFTPTQAEVDRAIAVLAAADEAAAEGSGVVVLSDGRFVDDAVVRQARRVLALAG